MASFKAESLRTDISAILDQADKEAVSAKAVRKALQEKYPELDVKTHKKAIDELTMSIFFKEVQNPQDVAEPPQASAAREPKMPKLHKIKKEGSPTSAEVPASSPVVPLAKKPVKREREETDEEMARRLQEEMNGMSSTGRATRNGGAATRKVKAKPRKKKSKSTVSDDESGEDGAPKKKRKVSNTGFNKPHLLSPEMSEVCGKQVLSRPGVTKAMWAYIKANGLQDPNKKTDILPDETLKRVLPFERINSFTMAKHISAHLYPFDPEEHGHLLEDEVDETKISKDTIDSSEDEK
ncbi:uncharacterized protein JCM15063_000179 [Sporobolomyces koalae]|uniref:uncharacterized protein n=1 Tax=Sporobolomyces koalae TaxID=500713 RepID=UPI00316D1472